MASTLKRSGTGDTPAAGRGGAVAAPGAGSDRGPDPGPGPGSGPGSGIAGEPLDRARFVSDRDEYGFTATSYAVLGTIALREWTTYELAQQMQRSFSYFWPRAERRIYDEPKRLRQAGYVRSRRETVGRRPRTCWQITERGRSVLRIWLGEPVAAPMTMEFEGLVKLFLSEGASKRQVLDLIGSIAEEARARSARLGQMSADLAGGNADFPERAHINALTMQFVVQQCELTADWADHAAEVVRAWHSPGAPGEAARVAARKTFTEIAESR